VRRGADGVARVVRRRVVPALVVLRPAVEARVVRVRGPDAVAEAGLAAAGFAAAAGLVAAGLAAAGFATAGLDPPRNSLRRASIVRTRASTCARTARASANRISSLASRLRRFFSAFAASGGPCGSGSAFGLGFLAMHHLAVAAGRHPAVSLNHRNGVRVRRR
ncbi:MAG: hypothetical protein ACRDF7_01105, partial [Candidatus Limnocylindrales bacterium]